MNRFEPDIGKSRVMVANTSYPAHSTGQADGIPPSVFWTAFALILAVGAGFRFWNLSEGASFWMDEAMTLAMARLPLDTILLDRIDNHPVLPYVVQHVWMKLVPDTAFARVPVAFTGVLAVAALMLMVRDQVNARAALIAGLLFAVSTGQIYYSQELRMYIFVVLGLVLGLWGALGMLNPRSMGMRAYAALYVAGGFIAIHSQLVGLIGMAFIGFSVLASARQSGNPASFVRLWFTANLVLFVLVLPWLVQIPDASRSFPGLPTDISPFEAHWHLRNAVGFAGLSGINWLQLLADIMLYGCALLGALAAWRSGRTGLAAALGALLIGYPVLVMVLQLQTQLIHTRTFLLCGIAVVVGAGLALATVMPRRLGIAGACLLGALSIASSSYELRHHNKAEDYAGAVAWIDEAGWSGAPVFTCQYFSSAAMWEARPDATIFNIGYGAILRYPGPDFWRILELSMSEFRRLSPLEIDAHLGGGHIVEGGLEDALGGADRFVFVRPICNPKVEQWLDEAARAQGYAETETRLITGRSADPDIIEPASTRVSLYRRAE